jgi:nitrogen fixation-related uncharacterized protein
MDIVSIIRLILLLVVVIYLLTCIGVVVFFALKWKAFDIKVRAAERRGI